MVLLFGAALTIIDYYKNKVHTIEDYKFNPSTLEITFSEHSNRYSLNIPEKLKSKMSPLPKLGLVRYKPRGEIRELKAIYLNDEKVWPVGDYPGRVSFNLKIK
jgi:hypothetical protein